MNEQEWLQCSDAVPMLESFLGNASARKARLFAVANCRQVWSLLEVQSRKSVEAAELFADELISRGELKAAHREAAQLSRIRMNLAMKGNDLSLFRSFYIALTAGWASDEFPLVAAIE